MALRLLLLALLAASASAQGRLAFDAEILDLGRIAEADGPVERTFRFTNAGDQPVRLTSVEASCGCTTPSWTEDAVAPGEEGVIRVAYDPAGRPGDFEKAVFVQAEGAEPNAVTLRVEGVVRPALADAGERIGSLAFNHTTADAGVAPAGEPLQTAFQFANAGAGPVRIERVDAPEGVEVASPSRPIFPDGLGGLFVSVADPAVLAEADAVAFEIVLHTTDAEAPVKRVTVTGRVGPPRVIPDGE
ncbi:DUF1573 domain-containing protein [Rubrivirga marina]|uniref:DUF1573 domain-containing protein n=1 Tax=Rubrivirga marina TaxID=1196024 RepID=A0A271IZR7_9BACT|nr:DUF1573 domain-containing protein [Rubrivirga marina]PAP76731.1 hypothetical protein BSZ37_09925 [Rubrivirga marina]